ncbi:response regulator transcription factor [Paenibacillus alkalitolerans]|uniref:response regulator transcription factor n=1 Tax=Paenibacillus alkalitolerans TaxID=2799335 RepID=UPI0018F397E3|nr:response regulator [Paenibacillus alkalitolerans]
MPYNVLIVDDEPLARAGLRAMYDWISNGFQVVGEASDGKKALQLMEKVHVDIVITDIAMPVMDGLEFSREARRRYPEAKILLLSCHNEFDYAREAMRFGASDYLLKAKLEPEDLHRSLMQIYNQLVRERRSAGERSLLSALDNINDWRASSGGHTGEYVIAVCVPVSLKTGLDARSEAGLYERMTGIYYRELPDDFAVRYGSRQLVLWISAKVESAAWEKICRLHLLWNNGHIPSTIGLSAVYPTRDGIRSAFFEAASAVQRQFFEGDGRIYKAPVRSAFARRDPAKFQECKKALKNALNEGFTEKAYELLVKIVSCWNETWTREDVIGQAKELVHVFLSADRDPKAKLAEELEAVDRCRHIESLKASLFTRLDRLFPKHECTGDYHSKAIAKAIEFIKTHYKDDISLTDAAAHVSMSRNYFCEQFKKHTGLTFIDFVTGVRMNAAKRLLQDQQCKIYEVAEQCGFNDVKHFSKQFRKVFGQSPKEFQGKFGQLTDGKNISP